MAQEALRGYHPEQRRWHKVRSTPGDGWLGDHFWLDFLTPLANQHGKTTMYCVKVLYPNKAGSSFNLKHYLDVHVPLGLGLLKKHCRTSARKIEVDVNPYGLTPQAHVPYHAIFSAYFDRKSDAAAFQQLFSIDEVVRELMADWPNYTEADPEIMISEVVEVDPFSFESH
jgi:uncharacterized protein (TIGR02118 family)